MIQKANTKSGAGYTDPEKCKSSIDYLGGVSILY
jgi:hypothetical protein